MFDDFRSKCRARFRSLFDTATSEEEDDDYDFGDLIDLEDDAYNVDLEDDEYNGYPVGDGEGYTDWNFVF